MKENALNFDGWRLWIEEYDPANIGDIETLTVLGNGYMGLRGATEEGVDGPPHTPGLFIAGVFDALNGMPELVNAPNWAWLRFHLPNEDWFDPSKGTLQYYRLSLDLRKGLLQRRMVWQGNRGQTIGLLFSRFVSMAEPDLAAIRCAIIPEGFQGKLLFESGLDGSITNSGRQHLTVLERIQASDECLALSAVTNQSRIVISVAGCTRCYAAPGKRRLQSISRQEDGRILHEFTVPVRSNEEYVLEKVVRVQTARLAADAPPEAAETQAHTLAQTTLHKVATDRRFVELLADHVQAWARLWTSSDLTIEGDPFAQFATRFAIFHLLQSASPHNKNIDASIAAKALHGEDYHGRVFGDTEIFMLPFFNFTQPQIARALLMYRVRRLPQARLNAKAHGYDGAMYPWESADTGEETAPRWRDPHPVTGQRRRIWTGDIEQHVSANVAYGIWQYYLATRDWAFIEQHGAEVIIETARFWLSRCVLNAQHDRYEILKVMGPDEYHEYYPGKADEGGIDNNVYTNSLARWNINKAIQIIGMFSKDKAEKLAQKLGLTVDALMAWRQKAVKVAEKIYIPRDARTGLYEQHTGFFDLKPLDWKSPPYNGRPDMGTALRAEGKDPADYQLLKQADVLMMLYLLPEMADRQVRAANYRYYEPRTSHGSSLSDAVHAIMAKEAGRTEAAYEYFRKAAAIDLLNAKGNRSNGIHAASLGGLWQATVCGFGGVTLREDRLAINPHLPDQWTRLAYRVLYRGSPVEVTIEGSSLRVSIPTRENGQEPVPMEIAGRNYTLHPGEERMAVI